MPQTRAPFKPALDFLEDRVQPAGGIVPTTSFGQLFSQMISTFSPANSYRAGQDAANKALSVVGSDPVGRLGVDTAITAAAVLAAPEISALGSASVTILASPIGTPSSVALGLAGVVFTLDSAAFVLGAETVVAQDALKLGSDAASKLLGQIEQTVSEVIAASSQALESAAQATGLQNGPTPNPNPNPGPVSGQFTGTYTGTVELTPGTPFTSGVRASVTSTSSGSLSGNVTFAQYPDVQSGVIIGTTPNVGATLSGTINSDGTASGTLTVNNAGAGNPVLQWTGSVTATRLQINLSFQGSSAGSIALDKTS